MGHRGARLERETADLIGARSAVAASSGTAALHLAVAAIGPDPGDEIITSPISDFDTVAPILAQNAIPVFADVDPLTGNLDPAAVAAAITPRTKAILAVHLFGAPAPVRQLRTLADQHDIALIEDCAQAWLALNDDGSPVGTTGSIGCFSLQQWKHITCGDGGIAVTSDPALAQRMRLFGDKGWARATGRHHVSFGLNYRMTELAGAVARAQLAKLPGVLASRRRTARQLIASVEGLAGLFLPTKPDSHAWWLFPVVLGAGLHNAEVAKKLAAAGIPARAGYLAEPLHCAPALTSSPVYGTGNRRLAQALETLQQRLLGYVTVHPRRLDQAERDLRELLPTKRFVGAKIHPDYTGSPLTSPQMRDALTMLAELDCPVLVHTWEASVLDLAQHCADIPGLRAIAGHMGAADTATLSPPRSLVIGSIWNLRGRTGLPGVWKKVLSHVDSRQLLLGTDATLIDPSSAFGVLAAARPSAATAERIAWRNAVELFGLSGGR